MLLYIMLYIMLAYIMLFGALSNAVCLYVHFLSLIFFFMPCLGLLTHSLFILNISLHHAQCFSSVGLPNSMFTPFCLMKGLCVFWRNRT